MTINGSKIAKEILDGLRPRIAALSFKPVLCDIVVGADPVSLSFVNIKKRTAERAGLGSELRQVDENIGEQELLDLTGEIQADAAACGLIIQLPLPERLNKQIIVDAIDPKIDVDCLGAANSREFYNNAGRFVPPTAGAIMAVLESLNIDFSTKQFLVVGQGELVGKPVTHLLRQKSHKIDTADQRVEDLTALTQEAGIIISGTGQPGLIRGDMVKPGTIVIDAGTSESGSGIVGDVDFDTVSRKAGAISPVPGGVGPVTVAKLLENVIIAAEEK